MAVRESARDRIGERLTRRTPLVLVLAATAQAMYALAAGATTALLTVASGSLYGAVGARGFLVMAVLCAAALPLARGLRRAQVTPS